ncbi:acylneuraminate cytidylyltransferase family protein [Polaribacter aquimarinus]|uniref:Acylneuraminate cytidylyltransferase n=1 Tax=Polaribacter aquimarinus TaxID=2100726 RepID=A0A2U2J7G4_9FLAO|nr:acylneuraminate cytidylyltransferase family protein [Polaribacter aquimarinus]PWG04280.1 hypothetical protein DIS07_12770 [Polaribacter aquimarinus]
MKVLGIIPARGGSKGVKKKNIRLLNEKPLIEYSINAAKKSKLLSHFTVTTDSEEIIDIAKQNNCNYHRRSIANSSDSSPIEPVIHEVLDSFDTDFDIIILLQPTAPARTGKDIDEVIKMFKDDEKLECVVSVVELNDIHPARMYNIHNQKLNSLEKENEFKRRQDLKPVYLRNGAFYAIKKDSFLSNNRLILENKKAYIMPEEKWINIDTERDLMIANLLIKNLDI